MLVTKSENKKDNLKIVSVSENIGIREGPSAILSPADVHLPCGLVSANEEMGTVWCWGQHWLSTRFLIK